MSIELYDNDAVQKKIDLLVNSGSLEEARNLYLETIMDWSDHFTENFNEVDLESTSSEYLNSLTSIVALWKNYAATETNQNQFKKAADVYAKALEDPIVNKCVELYLAYADFLVDRGKLASSKLILIKGLCLTSETTTQILVDSLWKKLLKISQLLAIGSTHTLNVKAIYEAVKLDKGCENVRPPSESLITYDSEPSVPTIDLSTSESKEEEVNITPINSQVISAPGVAVPIELPALEDIEDVSKFTPIELLAQYPVRPTMLLLMTEQEMRESKLAENEIAEIETFLQEKLPHYNLDAVLGPKLHIYLDVFECLWVTQALKERHFNHWFSELRSRHIKEELELRREDIEDFQSRCAFQSQLLEATVNKTLHSLLVEQETVLALAGFPRFNHEYLSLIKTQYNTPKVHEIIHQQKRLVGGLLSMRFDPGIGNHIRFPFPLATTTPLSAPHALGPIDDDAEDYYSIEAKEKRRKLRSEGVLQPDVI